MIYKADSGSIYIWSKEGSRESKKEDLEFKEGKFFIRIDCILEIDF